MFAGRLALGLILQSGATYSETLIICLACFLTCMALAATFGGRLRGGAASVALYLAAQWAGLRGFFGLTVLRRVGRRSIRVFTLHVVMMGLVQQADARALRAGGQQALGLAAFAAFVSLAAPHGAWQERAARQSSRSSASRLSERNSRR